MTSWSGRVLRIPVKLERIGAVSMLELGEGELVLLRRALGRACDHVWSAGVCEKCGAAEGGRS